MTTNSQRQLLDVSCIKHGTCRSNLALELGMTHYDMYLKYYDKRDFSLKNIRDFCDRFEWTPEELYEFIMGK